MAGVSRPESNWAWTIQSSGLEKGGKATGNAEGKSGGITGSRCLSFLFHKIRNMPTSLGCCRTTGGDDMHEALGRGCTGSPVCPFSRGWPTLWTMSLVPPAIKGRYWWELRGQERRPRQSICPSSISPTFSDAALAVVTTSSTQFLLDGPESPVAGAGNTVLPLCPLGSRHSYSFPL